MEKLCGSQSALSELAVFLPRSVYPLCGAALRGSGARKTVSGTVLFCDVAGFTPLTEALTAIGREGSEELTRVLNGYFTEMIGIIESYGGDVLRFGGDAMTVFFPGKEPAAALSAAWKMQQAMPGFATVSTRAGDYAISMKIGAAEGAVHLGIVGDKAIGFDYYAAGEPLDGSAEAEHAASPGEIVCHASLSVLPPGTDASLLACGHRKVGRLEPTEPAPRPKARLSRAVAAIVPDHLARHAGSIGGHRVTAVIFLALESLPEEAVPLHEAVAEAFSILASAARRHGGIVNKIDMGDKGAKAILLFGAPDALENKEEMAVRAAREIAASLRCRMGITSSPLFSGLVGAPVRRELTAMGDGMNLAARLMQAADPGQILAGAKLAAEARAFRFKALPRIRVKGKKDPVAVYEPVEPRRRAAESGPLVEREELLDLLARAVIERSGKPRVVVGEAGSGKTALLQQLARRAEQAGLPVTLVSLGRYSSEYPYALFQPIVLELCGIGPTASPEERLGARDRALAGEAAGHRPILNPLLGLPLEETRELRDLPAKARRDLTFAVIERLLSRSGRHAYLADNAGYADPLSLELLAFLAAEYELVPWSLAATSRTSIDGKFESLRLEPLSRAGLAEVLEKRHRLTNLAAVVVDWFVHRSGGNPAAIEALFEAVQAAGLVERDAAGGRIDPDRLARAELPEKLQDLHLARVDRLPAGERRLLEVASVLGESVSGTLLSELFGADPEPLVESLAKRGDLARDQRGKRPYYRFTDSLVREAVYQSLAFAVRREHHRKVATLLDREERENPRAWAALARHWRGADEPARARRYAALAGRAAYERFDNRAALPFLEEACEPLTPDVSEEALLLLNVYKKLGRWNEARPLLARLLRMRRELPLRFAARLRTWISVDHETRQRYKAVERSLDRAILLARETGEAETEARARLSIVGRLYGPMGRLDEARSALKTLLAMPELNRYLETRALAEMNMGVLWTASARRSEANRWYARSRRHAPGPLAAQVAHNLAGLAAEEGRFASARRYAEEALRGLEEFARRPQIPNARINLAQALICLGRVAEAERQLRTALRHARIYGLASLAAMATAKLVQSLWLEGDLEGALASGREGLEAFAKLENPREFGSLFCDLARIVRVVAPGRNPLGLLPPGSDELFARARQDASCKCAMERILGGDLTLGGALPPEESLERTLQQAERNRSHAPSRAAVGQALRGWPHFEARIRVYRLSALSGALEARDRGRAVRLLREVMGGVFGLSLAAILGRHSRPMRKKTIERIRFFRDRAPDWAFAGLRSRPEFRDYLEVTR